MKIEQKKIEKIHQAKKLLCIIIKKNKVNYFNSVNEKNITDNSKFLKNLKDTIKTILPNVMRCSRLQLWVGYFIYFIFTRVSSIVNQTLHLEFNYKGICVSWPPCPGPDPRPQFVFHDPSAQFAFTCSSLSVKVCYSYSIYLCKP